SGEEGAGAGGGVPPPQARAGHLKKSDGFLRPGRREPAMIFRVIRDHLVPEFTVVDCCRVLKVSTSGYYGWRKAPVGKRQARRAELVEQIRSVHEAGRRVYGAPRVHRALLATGVKRNRKTVARIM